LSGVVDLQVYSLLSRLHAEREAGCSRLREAAAEQSRRLVGEARARARLRIKEAVKEKRRRVEEHCRQVRVRLEARHRDEHFAELGKRLREGLGLLPDALAARWSDEASRRRWCRMVLHTASATLRSGTWRIEVARGMSPAERNELAAGAGRLAGEDVSVGERDDLTAGIVVLHDGVRLDATIAGLLSDTARVEAALLAGLGAGEWSS
jgi:hypothetical protein